MGILVDVLIIAFILLSTFFAYKKGLVALGIKLCAFVLAIVVTFLLYKPVGNLVINATSIDETIENTIYSKVTELIQENPKDEISNELIQSAKDGMLPQAARTMAIDIVYVGVMILLFLAVRIGLVLITSLANAVAKLPILAQFNKGGGAIYGVLRGLILIYASFIVISMIGTLNPYNSVHQAINQSYLGKTMYENNILNVFFKTS